MSSPRSNVPAGSAIFAVRICRTGTVALLRIILMAANPAMMTVTANKPVTTLFERMTTTDNSVSEQHATDEENQESHADRIGGGNRITQQDETKNAERRNRDNQRVRNAKRLDVGIGGDGQQRDRQVGDCLLQEHKGL